MIKTFFEQSIQLMKLDEVCESFLLKEKVYKVKISKKITIWKQITQLEFRILIEEKSVFRAKSRQEFTYKKNFQKNFCFCPKKTF